ncbi:MAG TPA: HAD family hydrolase [Clostridiales bacterium]|nr:HAD family hydrolase [Clostridiales bacterium]
MYDGVIFDLDGTLWNSTSEVAYAFNKVVKEKHPEITDEITVEKLQSLFGKPLDEIAVKLFLSVSEEHAIEVMRECCEYECRYLAEHGAILYDGLEDTLKALQKKYKLFIVSNCQDGYIECFFEAYPHLQQYFTDYECPGRTGKFKADNIRLVIERNKLENPIYVGDTQGDADACKEAEVAFIFARYGFGNVQEYERAIDSLGELLEILA